MKKLLCSVLVMCFLLAFPICASAYNTVSPDTFPFLVKDGDTYRFKNPVPAASQNDRFLAVWNAFQTAISGNSRYVPIVIYGESPGNIFTIRLFLISPDDGYSFSTDDNSGLTYFNFKSIGESINFRVSPTGSYDGFGVYDSSSRGSFLVSNSGDRSFGFMLAPYPTDFPSNVNVFAFGSDVIPLQPTLTINYQYDDGSVAANPYSGAYSKGELFEITSPVISGFYPSIEVVSGQMGDSDLSYTVTYKPIKHSLTINYQYENGSQASSPYTGTFAEGEPFNITTPVLSGFKPSINIVSGQMGNTDLSYTVTYTPIKHNLTINYQYENGSQALEPYSGTFAEGESFSITVPVIGGFKPSVSVISGKMENKDLTYTVTYSPITHTVSVKYQFEDGSQAAEPYTGSFAEGQPYSIPTPIIEGFTPSLSIISGEMGTGDLSYTVIFTKDKEPEPPPSSSEDSSSGGESSGGGSSSGESSGGGSSGGSSSGGGSGEGSSGGRGYVVWNPALVAQGFKNVSNQAGMAFNTGIWVFLGITGIVLMIKLLRDLFK